ncbi:SDR family oxidoreductase [Hymenobacter ginsengisoli]|uniref:SDR family oxidoreductase n=1 Tax=Hymenobacter ginsengisoli TaxID=1051626 RepID=A0ABP8QL99_9BACT|nr:MULTISPECIES: SDR family oxidoreductase [unclassified Hymenobacter]MBO2031242.1 SDR family oxidoreductase [Hymenobacter sp. BT559]
MSTPKIALVTGGSRGLGKDMALNLAKKGLDVILTYHTQQAAADAVVAEIAALGQRAVALQLDASQVSTFGAFFEQLGTTLRTTFGVERFDFLINNAGTGYYAPFAETAEQQFDELVNIHLKGPFFLTQQALPLLNDGGGIINISSGLTRITFPGSSAYASLKTAVETLTKYQAKELASRRIRANIVAPGAIETDFGGGRTRDNKEINAHIAGLTAMGRVGLPTDVGPVVAFLCTPEANWIDAQRIEVSGGQGI